MLETLTDATICPRCGQPNQCAVVTGSTDCWCRQVPLLPQTISKTAAQAAVCYCPGCLAELTAAGDSQQGAEAQQYKAKGSA
ncbi:cysteine-rich CWC family protein [Rheinheimera sp. F8]|uniref:cysteine-rich CWC family protein n=1 Tax=Rheinheimera sp. F8 TaxID=1763998 RepID=UPI001AD7F535|nr:cysteine-rich CWC family protein [Rheinheimera sp. F8]